MKCQARVVVPLTDKRHGFEPQIDVPRSAIYEDVGFCNHTWPVVRGISADNMRAIKGNHFRQNTIGSPSLTPPFPEQEFSLLGL